MPHQSHQIQTELQWEAACERLRSALHPEPIETAGDLDLAVPGGIVGALDIAESSLRALREAHVTPSAPGETKTAA